MKLRSPAILTAIGVVATLVLALAVVMLLLRTGDAEAVSDNAALIGALVALGGVFTAQMVGIALDDRRTKESRSIEERRTQEARELEAQRAHEAALQNYFQQVGKLLIEQPLRRASPGDYLSTVVRAQTLAVLGGLDPDRKRILLEFLYESGLIHKDKPVVILALANLREANLSNGTLAGSNLRGTSLARANLSKCNLIMANLRGAYLHRANLGGSLLCAADLSGAALNKAYLGGAQLGHATLINASLDEAYLGKGFVLRVSNGLDHDENAVYVSGANLSNAILREANFSNANLARADLSKADLSRAKLIEANLRDGANLRKANLTAANLSGAILSEANLYVADLTEADLIEADLSGTRLSRSNLSGADLSQAKGITNEQLKQQAASLEGATMPNGQKYEDWLKDREGRGDDGENSGSS